MKPAASQALPCPRSPPALRCSSSASQFCCPPRAAASACCRLVAGIKRCAVLIRDQLELSDDNGDIVATSRDVPFSVANMQKPRRLCAHGEAMRIIAPAAGSVVNHAFLAAMRRLPVFFSCDAVPGAVHRLLLNSDVYLQWNEGHVQSLDADFGELARGRRFRSKSFILNLFTELQFDCNTVNMSLASTA